VVVGVTRNTEGYGKTLRLVGVNVDIEYRFDDPDPDVDKMIVRKSTITVPYELRSAVTVGDGMIIEFGHPSSMVVDGIKEDM
jgi:hypothetical protein